LFSDVTSQADAALSIGLARLTFGTVRFGDASAVAKFPEIAFRAHQPVSTTERGRARIIVAEGQTFGTARAFGLAGSAAWATGAERSIAARLLNRSTLIHGATDIAT
jgi:hypothetical protein